jgi:hypothetical protein
VIQHSKILDSYEDVKDEFSLSPLIVIPIYQDQRKHAASQKISCLYVATVDSWNRYIIPLNHSEKAGDILLQQFLNAIKDCNIYVWDKKSFLNHTLDDSNIFDIQLVYYFNNKIIEAPELFNSQYRRLYRFDNINEALPLSYLYDQVNKWLESIDIFNTMYTITSTHMSESFKKYQSVLHSFYELEKNGIFHKTNGIEYTQYNLYTATGRPSNRFNGINYAAMNKKDDTRSNYTSRHENGKLYLFDYSAFHPTIIANFLNIDRPESNTIHTWLAQQYYNKKQISDNEYEESKKKTFYHLYGDMSSVTHIEFFRKVKDFIDIMSGESEIISPIYKRPIDVSGFSKEKIFNYFLQCLESEINFGKIKKLNEILKNKRTKLVLYTYDSFLIDWHPDDEYGILKQIKQVLEAGNFNVTVEYYNFSFNYDILYK